MTKVETGVFWSGEADGSSFKYDYQRPRQDKLPAGSYKGVTDQLGNIWMVKTPITSDKLLDLEDKTTVALMREFEIFWNSKQKFKDMGLLHKRGILLWGPPGTGKTATLATFAKKMVEENDGIVIVGRDPGEMHLSFIREIEPTRPIVVFLEDFDTLVDEYDEEDFLQILDGADQIDGVMFIATTNYPEKLDKRFTERPSRFDTLMKVGFPTAEVRHAYLSKRFSKLTEAEKKAIVDVSEGLSIAHLKEILIAGVIFGQNPAEAAERLRNVSASFQENDETPTTKASEENADKLNDVLFDDMADQFFRDTQASRNDQPNQPRRE